MYVHYILAAILVAQGCSAWESKIINGEPAEPHQYPHQVAIFLSFPPVVKDKFQCGGVIIDAEWILTAGQCVADVEYLTIKAGKYDITEEEASVQVRYPIKAIRHEDYRRPIANKLPAQNDIALLKLNEPLVFNENVKSINLPKFHAVHTGFGNLSGWGSVSLNLIPHYPDKLQSVQLAIIDNKHCGSAINNNWYDKILVYVVIRDSQVCTGAIGDNSGACHGDTGGGLVQFNPDNNQTELVGIVSWTRFPCGKTGLPIVYTRVSEYIDWIVTNQAKDQNVY